MEFVTIFENWPKVFDFAFLGNNEVVGRHSKMEVRKLGTDLAYHDILLSKDQEMGCRKITDALQKYIPHVIAMQPWLFIETYGNIVVNKGGVHAMMIARSGTKCQIFEQIYHFSWFRTQLFLIL